MKIQEDPIYVKHPDDNCNKSQREFLSAITDPMQLELHAYLFNMGNATYRYHSLAKKQEPTPELHEMWLEGLEEPMKSDFTKRGFEQNRSVLPFTRFVMEMADVGMGEFVMKLLNEQDRETYRKESQA